jgi:hypothetical protein
LRINKGKVEECLSQKKEDGFFALYKKNQQDLMGGGGKRGAERLSFSRNFSH